MKKFFRHLGEFIYNHKHKYIIGVVLLLIVDGLQLLTPLVLGDFVDELTQGTLTVEMIPTYMILVVAIAAGVAAGRYGWRMAIIGTAKKMEYWTRVKLFKHFEGMSTNYFNHHKTGDLMAHCTNDIQTIRQSFGQGFILVVDASFVTIMATFLMITRVNFKLTVVSLVPLPLIAFAMFFIGKLIRKRFENVQRSFSDLSDKAQESFSGIRIIKSFVQEKAELKDFNIKNKENFDNRVSLVKVSGTLHPLIHLIATFSMVVAVIYGGFLVIDNTITIGELVTFLSYIGMLAWPMMALGMVFNLIERGKVSINRLNVLLDTPPEILSEELVKEILDVKPSIEIKDLTFTYTGAEYPALENINMKIDQGQTVAIVGRTGAGKTTLVNLLLHLYNVDNGSIFFGGHDINKIPVSTPRDLIGYVPQDNFLFSKSIKENISFANETLDFDSIKHSAKIAQVHKEIINFPYEYETELGERGVNMSGGQKQRVSIARALEKNPEILIFDDSLSAVDTKTEESIMSHLKEELNHKTAILIAHRISTIKDSDKIFVLDEGKIVEEGTHNQLVKLGGIYSEMHQKQLLEDKIEKE